jgi:hypothetical protein
MMVPARQALPGFDCRPANRNNPTKQRPGGPRYTLRQVRSFEARSFEVRSFEQLSRSRSGL